MSGTKEKGLSSLSLPESAVNPNRPVEDGVSVSVRRKFKQMHAWSCAMP